MSLIVLVLLNGLIPHNLSKKVINLARSYTNIGFISFFYKQTSFDVYLPIRPVKIMPILNHTQYIGSYPSVSSCPEDERPEYAFIGRSNVGKSSLINMLTNRNSLARISKKPGKTQMINYFLVENSWYLVDLPGYGYAKVSKKKRREWKIMIEGYLLHRKTLACAFVLIDANIPAQKIDIEFMNWLGDKCIPFVLVYTKTDRLKPVEIGPNIQKIQQELLQYWDTLPQQFITSSIKKEGQKEILDFIQQINAELLEE